MDVYWVTFRIDNGIVNGRNYEARYDALIAALNEHCSDAWEEPTSFVLIKSNSSTSQIAASVKRAIATTHDLVVIGSMNYTGITAVGLVSDPQRLARLEARITWA